MIVQWGCLSSHERYNAYLLATLRARGPLETHLDDSCADRVFPAWSSRRLTPAIEEDVLDLALTPLSPPPAAERAEPLGAPAILGALYVLEGSALGAKILKRQAAEIGLTPSYGARHLDRQTTAPHSWASFLECLETHPLDAADDDRCVKSAVDTFEAFERAYQSMV